jgi:hypothetical protein
MATLNDLSEADRAVILETRLAQERHSPQKELYERILRANARTEIPAREPVQPTGQEPVRGTTSPLADSSRQPTVTKGGLSTPGGRR